MTAMTTISEDERTGDTPDEPETSGDGRDGEPFTPERAPADHACVQATGHELPIRRVPLPKTEAVVVDIIDRYASEPGQDSRQGGGTVHVGTDVIINGRSVYTPRGTMIQTESCGHDGTKITMTFFARRVRIGFADELGVDA